MTELEAFAVELARIAADVSLPYFRTDVEEDNKAAPGQFDPVTEADRAAERAMREVIEARYPDHGIIGEEYGEKNPDADQVWILDPIDGTRAFIAGLPLWTNLIGLRQSGVPVIGVVGQPYTGEIFIGGPSGARLLTRSGEKALKTRSCALLSDALAATTDADIFQNSDREGWERLKKAVRLARYGCDAYAYAMLASGRIDVVAESELKVWDWTALMPLVVAAGGQFSGWDGKAPTSADGRVLAVGDAALAPQALKLLNG